MHVLTLNLDRVHLTDEQFWQLCQRNRDWQFELTATGELMVMAPVGGESGNQEPANWLRVRLQFLYDLQATQGGQSITGCGLDSERPMGSPDP
jgi:hypothetical protein